MGFLPQETIDRLNGTNDDAIRPKRGVEIFEGTDYPQDWDGFVGQNMAKDQLQTMIASALARKTRIEHTILESGVHGIGKTTLAHLVAFYAGAGLIETTGPLSADEARTLMMTMSDGDVLFIDEAHLLVGGGRNKADWLLPYMTEGKLYTSRGAEQMPDVAIIAATTEAGKLPETLLSRFMCYPSLGPYSNAEATILVGNLASRMRVDVPEVHWAEIARASNKNPRAMRKIITQVRDLKHVRPETHPNMETALQYSGFSADGLTQTARHMLIVLATTEGHKASIDTIKVKLGEPGSIRYHEAPLLQRGYIEITGQGRRLTDAGRRRAMEERA